MHTKLYCLLFCLSIAITSQAQATQKPVLHGRHWMAITGKPLAATAGSMVFQKGGNAIDATCAMLAATCTMWDVLSWGGETQALIYNPKTKKAKNNKNQTNIRNVQQQKRSTNHTHTHTENRSSNETTQE